MNTWNHKTVGSIQESRAHGNLWPYLYYLLQWLQRILQVVHMSELIMWIFRLYYLTQIEVFKQRRVCTACCCESLINKCNKSNQLKSYQIICHVQMHFIYDLELDEACTHLKSFIWAGMCFSSYLKYCLQQSDIEFYSLAVYAWWHNHLFTIIHNRVPSANSISYSFCSFMGCFECSLEV